MSPPRILLVVSLAACVVPEDLGTVEQEAIATNAIATNAIATNAIATNAIATNAIATNAIATNAIATKGILTGAVSDPDVSHALHDPNARVFMKYLVSCALHEKQQVRWRSHDGQISETWDGGLGLCPSWMEQAPDPVCRQRVSACILARNNMFGVSVKFSMRGTQPGGAIEMSPVVPPHSFHPQSPVPVASLAPCTPPSSGLRDCGWSVASVGRCDPKTTVSIAQGNDPACSGTKLGKPSSVDTMLRVCDGISACDSGRELLGVDKACGHPEPAGSFACPASGIYSVMIAPHDSLVALPNDGSIAATSSYPSPELDVFLWREGAFFGDLFGEANLDPNKPEVYVDGKYVVRGVQESSAYIGVAFPNLYACASSNWTEPRARFERRVCAGPDPQQPGNYTRDCAARYVGTCNKHCAINDALGQGDYDYGDCSDVDPTVVWRFPATTVLSEPCDAVPGFCGTVNPLPDFGL